MHRLTLTLRSAISIAIPNASSSNVSCRSLTPIWYKLWLGRVKRGFLLQTPNGWPHLSLLYNSVRSGHTGGKESLVIGHHRVWLF